MVLFQNNNFEIYQGERSTAAMAHFALTTSPASAFVPVVVDPNEVHAPPPALPQDGRVRAFALVVASLTEPAEGEDAQQPVLSQEDQQGRLARRVVRRPHTHSSQAHRGGSVLGSGFDADLIPIVNNLAEVLARADVSVGKVNALHDVEASDKLGLTSFPAFVLYALTDR